MKKTFNDLRKHMESTGRRDGIECAILVMAGRGQTYIALIIYENFCKVNKIEPWMADDLFEACKNV